MAVRIYKLANPRGVYFICEVCNRDATIMCPHCKVTYYCSEKHQQVDWASVHGTICYLLPSLRSPHSFRFNVSSDPNFKTTLKANLLKNLIELTKVMAHQYLFRNCPLMALPAAIRSLHFNHQLHGSDSLQNVPSLLLITESKLGLGHLDQARQLFAQAQWLTIKYPNCPDEILSQLYRTCAKIKFAVNDLKKVKAFSSKDIYHCSKKYGPSSHHVAGGYYQLGLTFEREGQIGVFKSLLSKVTDIWMAHLTKMVKLKIYHYLEEDAKSKPEDSTICLDVAQQAEAMQMLDNIFNKTGSKKAAHCLAMLYFIKDKISLAQKYGRIALLSYNSNFDAENPEYLVTAYQFMSEYEARPVSVGSSD